LSGWNALNPAQKQSLLPLATSWGTLTESQRRKWLALTKNFASMSPADQATLHSRMTEWAALSPQQRSRARLNFGETRQLPPTEKKAQWEAYQALSPEEKRRLAESRNTNSAGTATALKPVPPQKQVHVPEVTAHRQNAPTVVIPTPLVNQKTLLPRKTAPAASTPARNP
jgi:hypothetical protein